MRGNYNRCFSHRGYTVIELVIIVVIVGVLAVFSIMKFKSFMESTSIVVTKHNLAIMRKGVWDFYTEEASVGDGRFPTAAEVSEQNGGSVITGDGNLPNNVFDKDGDPNNVVTATDQPMGTIIGVTGGWAYRPSESSAGAGDGGQIWANTSTSGIDENRF